MSSKILLLEDDESLSETLMERLQAEGYRAVLAATKAQALKEFEGSLDNDCFDLLILDVGLPDGSGLDFARDVRLKSAVPIVFLSAMNSASYRLEGYEIGAEDYIPKPFHLKELLLRIAKVLSKKVVNGTISFEGFSVDFQARTVNAPGQDQIFLSAKDSDVLKYLIEVFPRVVSRQELIKNVWKEQEDSQSGRTVDNSIVRLRQLLKQFNVECIRSVRGVGYQWVLSPL